VLHQCQRKREILVNSLRMRAAFARRFISRWNEVGFNEYGNQFF